MAIYVDRRLSASLNYVAAAAVVIFLRTTSKSSKDFTSTIQPLVAIQSFDFQAFCGQSFRPYCTSPLNKVGGHFSFGLQHWWDLCIIYGFDFSSCIYTTAEIKTVNYKGEPSNFFRPNLGFCPKRLDPPSLPEIWDTKNHNIWCLFCILGHSKHFNV